jgi:hypothetical protein
MANPGVPPGGMTPNRRNVEALLSPIVGDTSNLAYDLRTQAGRTAKRIYSDQLSEADIKMGKQGSGEYLSPKDYAASQQDIGINDKAAAFQIAEIPTSSSNYSRPRTVAAGYDPTRNGGTMTVVFRDGTFYNYYEVRPDEWEAFHSSYSKGKPWLNRGFSDGKQKVDGLFISKPRGAVSDPSLVDPQIREALYRVARTSQQVRKPYAARTATQKAPTFQHLPNRTQGQTSPQVGTIKGAKRQRPVAYRKQYGINNTTKGKP